MVEDPLDFNPYSLANKKRFYLHLDGEPLGKLSFSSTSVEYESVETDGTMIKKVTLASAVHKFYMPGLILSCKSFKMTNSIPNEFHIWIDSDDCILFELYPFENKKLYVMLMDRIEHDKLPFEVYNEEGASSWLPDTPFITTKVEGDDDDSLDEQERVLELLPDLNNQVVCPKCLTYENSIWYVVQHLNDTHKWKRETIADWLETLDADITFPIGEENGNED